MARNSYKVEIETFRFVVAAGFHWLAPSSLPVQTRQIS